MTKRPTDFVDVVVAAKEMEPLKEKREKVYTQKKMDWVWLAGVLDGEGSLMIVRANADNFAPRIMVANTNLDFLQQVEKITGCGSIKLAHKESLVRKKGYKWTCDVWDDIIQIIEEVHPYLIIKRLQASVLLLFCQTRNSVRGRRTTPDTKKYRELLYEFNKDLNHRGSSV